jgi:hypothetical protein
MRLLQSKESHNNVCNAMLDGLIQQITQIWAEDYVKAHFDSCCIVVITSETRRFCKFVSPRPRLQNQREGDRFLYAAVEWKKAPCMVALVSRDGDLSLCWASGCMDVDNLGLS